MTYFIATDEAGYGPNLGPLVISATVWHAPDDVTAAEQLYERLGDCVTPKKVLRRNLDKLPVAMADSKLLYTSGGGWEQLERGLWAAWSLLGQNPASSTDVWRLLDPHAADELQNAPWSKDFSVALPTDWTPPVADPFAAFRERFAESGVSLVSMSSRVVFPEEFNRLLDEIDNKSTVLSHATLDLISRTMSALDAGSIRVLCDKHGGRDRYGPLLQHFFPDSFVEIRGEGRHESVYQFGPAERRVEFRFRAKADNLLPAALASMASKYLRELAMEAFNAFWRSKVPGLVPTAGYPEDAKRFIRDIDEAKMKLGVDDKILWRRK